MSLDEFSLIERIRARTVARADIVLGIGDDAALLQMPPGQQLVVTADTLNAGVHFPVQTLPADIGWKALAVNLSDLAAMGARPAWCTLALSLPAAEPHWIDAFAEGFFALADAHGMALVGGDTTRGPLSISITAMGWVPQGGALRRDGARVGDDIWVTGIPGEAAAALALWQAGKLDVAAVAAAPERELLRQRLLRPVPRLPASQRLHGIARSCVDVSDGLLADLGHICTRSGVGAEVWLERLPRSPALAALADAEQRRQWQLAGGDDYELCFTAPPQLREQVALAMEFAATPASRIGRITATLQVLALDASGVPWQPPRAGYNHFA
ncbi:thiamine-phosphate kinase [Stenotrophomonas sp. YIM B06876]|uniref:thiamine-phosphate kinase n=1 Tax=Stenotrophomonas sp. YIM B06876 TaxID=3060211 RepID=UPI002738B314|nr:thiamine-phosphate kinase [Stenotrophomonas sp. YIM B06876]